MVSRAAVLPMTVVSGLVAALLAVGDPGWTGGGSRSPSPGIVLAHIANNLMNDLYDEQAGSDTAGYPRALYAPHPVLSGLVTRRALLTAIVLVNLADLAILVILAAARGWPVVAFAVAGFVLSVAYTAPPLRLKKRGLGEPDVLVVWGPLMVGGTYVAATGSITWEVLLASLPYGLLCTTVLMGKHIDKIPSDHAPLGIRTLPVILGAAPRPRRDARADGGVLRGPVALCGLLVGAMPWPALRRGARAAATGEGVAPVPPPATGGAAARLPGLAALVRGARVGARAPGGCPIGDRTRNRRRPAGDGRLVDRGLDPLSRSNE